MEYIRKLNNFFDKRFSHIADFDLITRLSSICKVAYCPQVLSGWRIHQNNASFKENEKFITEKIKWINTYSESTIFGNHQNSIDNLDILMRAESFYLNLNYKKLSIKDFISYSGNFKSKIKILICFFPFLLKFIRFLKNKKFL